MRSYDLSPLYRSTVGFDRLFSMLDQVTSGDSAPTFPPFNIERTGDASYRISIAVAGFASNELTIETRENTLTVSGAKANVANGNGSDASKKEILHQGIAARSFERRFQLADHVKVTTADLENGLLHIDLVREVPEAQKPRTVQINVAGKKAINAKATEAGTSAEVKKAA